MPDIRDVRAMGLEEARAEYERARIKKRDWHKELMRVKTRLDTWGAYREAVGARIDQLLNEMDRRALDAEGSDTGVAQEQAQRSANAAGTQSHVAADAQDAEAFIAELEAATADNGRKGKASRTANQRARG